MTNPRAVANLLTWTLGKATVLSREIDGLLLSVLAVTRKNGALLASAVNLN